MIEAGSVEMGQQAAGQIRYRIMSGGKMQGYRLSIDPIASGRHIPEDMSLIYFLM
jgi:hypothetical protein